MRTAARFAAAPGQLGFLAMPAADSSIVYTCSTEPIGPGAAANIARNCLAKALKHSKRSQCTKNWSQLNIIYFGKQDFSPTDDLLVLTFFRI
jgi:hypothetical protein